MEHNHDNGIPAVDQIANGGNLQMYKAVIPYLPTAMQKNCILMIKMMEMNNLLSYYNSPMSACSASSKNISPEDLLSEIRQYGSDTQNLQIDQILNLLSAVKLYQTYCE